MIHIYIAYINIMYTFTHSEVNCILQTIHKIKLIIKFNLKKVPENIRGIWWSRTEHITNIRDSKTNFSGLRAQFNV